MKNYQKEHRGYQKIETKTITCIDCGKEVKVDALDNQTTRCKECYNKYRRRYKTQKDIERYHKKKISDSTN